ncbi:MAG: holo-ACP synthase [Candidatus Omnitrophica bacterium]|nr:holo-ACP synthase [Candidatus Omnitrophota bacterium]
MPGTRCGVDLVKVPRIQEAIEKHGKAFLERIFTPGEIDYCESRERRKFEHYAGRFAAKEAFYKAVSPEHAHIRFKNLEVRRLPNGAPSFFVPDDERARIGIGRAAKIAVTISHDTDYAVAFVVID